MILLDYNATTPLHPAVLEAMRPFFFAAGNPSSIHAAGRAARAGVDEARESLAEILQCRPHEVIFTGGGTESNNLAIIGLALAHGRKGRHVVTSSTEHHAVLHACDYLEKFHGFEITRLGVDSTGRVDVEEFASALREDTVLASVMTANNETGTLQPVSELAEVCRERGVLFHSDAVQSFGKMETIPGEMGVTAMSLAAHKFYGPKGAGVLYLEAGVPIEPLLHGGAQENQRRPGTENVPAIVGMAAAARLAVDDMAEEMRRQEALRERLRDGILRVCPEALENGHPTERLANTLNFCFPDTDGEMLLAALDVEGVGVSSGSACMVGSVQPSHVLLAMGRSPELARAAVRFSLGKPTTQEEIDAALDAFQRVWERMRGK